MDSLACFEAFSAATRRGDAEAIAAMATPDATVWHNDDDVTMSVEASNRGLRWLHRTVPDVAWADVAVSPTPTGFVWQSLLTGTAPGGPLRVHSCVVVTLAADGEVQRIEEYLDSAALAVLRAASPLDS